VNNFLILIYTLILSTSFSENANATSKKNGVVVMGYMGLKLKSTNEAEKEIFQTDVCHIYQIAALNNIPALFLTDKFRCGDDLVDHCANQNCDFSKPALLKQFITQHGLENLDIYAIGHGGQNFDYGRPPEKNTMDLGPDFQNFTPQDLAQFISQGIEGRTFNRLRFFFSQCFSGSFHETVLALLKDKQTKLACSVSQTSHNRRAFINPQEVRVLNSSLFAKTFTDMLCEENISGALSSSAELDNSRNLPTFPSILAWQTSSMYLTDKFTHTGFFYSSNLALTTPSTVLSINYAALPKGANDYSLEIPSFFPRGLNLSHPDLYFQQFAMVQTLLKSHVEPLQLLNQSLECEGSI